MLIIGFLPSLPFSLTQLSFMCYLIDRPNQTVEDPRLLPGPVMMPKGFFFAFLLPSLLERDSIVFVEFFSNATGSSPSFPLYAKSLHRNGWFSPSVSANVAGAFQC